MLKPQPGTLSFCTMDIFLQIHQHQIYTQLPLKIASLSFYVKKETRTATEFKALTPLKQSAPAKMIFNN